jgi:16S rRNA (guanine527-N7)-methyltransferase
MPTLENDRIAALLSPYLGNLTPPPTLYTQLSAYLDLLLRWNALTNLTSIRQPEDIVRRHFGESLFAGAHLATRLPPTATLLDFGSGAGFPGLPIQLLLPDLRVTLAESQNKKSTFLREIIRTLNLPTGVWAARVETMPPARQFDAVALRAVDHMQRAVTAAWPRVAPGGWLVTLSTETTIDAECIPLPHHSPGWLTLIQYTAST